MKNNDMSLVAGPFIVCKQVGMSSYSRSVLALDYLPKGYELKQRWIFPLLGTLSDTLAAQLGGVSEDRVRHLFSVFFIGMLRDLFLSHLIPKATRHFEVSTENQRMVGFLITERGSQEFSAIRSLFIVAPIVLSYGPHGKIVYPRDFRDEGMLLQLSDPLREMIEKSP